MTVLITGSGGFVGANLVRGYAAEHRVVAVDIAAPDDQLRLFLGEAAAQVEFVGADLTTDDWWREVPSRDYDIVIHAAAVTPVTPDDEVLRAAETVRVNIGGVVQVMAWAAKSRPARIIHLSSGAAYGIGPPGASCLTEDMPLAPESLYGITKAAGERLAQRLASLQDLALTVVRLTHTFGPMERPTLTRKSMSPLYEWCTAALAGRPVSTSSPGRLRDYAYVEDVARAVMAVARTPQTIGGTYNISSGEPFSEDDTLRHLASILPVERVEGGATTSAVSSMRPPLSADRLERDTGFRCETDLGKSVERYVRWMQENRRSTV